ncbi:hypothetical protein NQ318_006083 [Aromia moschata]|uniref:Uncharacterized protein n=1 Tax=Aromia moschata TaxID=1265417 RepID=A0AAV8Z3J7_9CUCU|nr:hypothetical protein NQ318_006083 [Aromia moschata]
MFKFVVVLALTFAAASADPKPGVLAAAPLLGAPASVVTATSSQSFVRNAVAAPLVASPYLASPYLASPYLASPYLTSPYLTSPYVASPYAAPLIAV